MRMLIYLRKRVKSIIILSFLNLFLLDLTSLEAQGQVDNQSTLRKTTSYKVQELIVGNKAPDILFQNVLNYKNNKAKLSDFKDKLVILDMWNVHCNACIAAFPKMQKMQDKFQDKIQILLVNPNSPPEDSENNIKSLFAKIKSRTGFYPALPIPIHDSLLKIYFPHKIEPHEVWLDGNGTVVAITNSEDVNEKNIQSILDGKKVNIAFKNDWKFDRTKPLLLEGNGGTDDFLFRSLFTKYKPGAGGSEGIRGNADGQVVGYYIINSSLRYLVLSAYVDSTKNMAPYNFIFNVADKSKYKSEDDTSNLYCYDLTIPPIPQNSFDQNKYLQEDLRRFFNITTHTEMRRMPCFVITATDKIIQSDPNKERNYDLGKTALKKYIQHCTIEETFKLLNYHTNIPLVDETGISQELIDIDFPANFYISNTEAIIQILRNKGFNIRKEERDIKVLVITDK